MYILSTRKAKIIASMTVAVFKEQKISTQIQSGQEE